MSKMKNELKNDPLMPLRHSAEHVLQTAMESLFPGLKKVMGPSIEDGFYGDFDFNGKISQEDFEKIEKRMQEIIEADLSLIMKEVSPEEAKRLFSQNPYKLEFLEEIIQKGEKITVCELGKSGDKFHDVDLCMGGHVAKTGAIKAFKLLSVAGAYWRGDEKNKMLTRIYGTAFESKKELDEYLELLEEARARDHRKLGKDLDLFAFDEKVGGGLPLWTPKGTVIRDTLEDWAKDTEKAWGYKRVATPHIGKEDLYLTSGHLPYYKDDMYPAMEIEGENYYLKGMNCPHHHCIYNASPKSYRDLPLRYAEYGTVYRYELSGSLFGLMRVRSIAQNDAHIYCSYDQAVDEFVKSLELYDYYYSTLGLSKSGYYAVIGLPSEEKKAKYHGDKKMWDLAEKMTREAVTRFGIEYKEDIGGAAFYGPKIDINVRSSIGKEYSISTAQLDLYMPTRFHLEFTNRKGEKELCAVIHRAPLGSHERFIGFLIEHFGGAFPVWLNPVQVAIINIGEKHLDYAKMLESKLIGQNIRVEVFGENDTMGAKIRKAQEQKIPYMIILGDKEVAENKISVRNRLGEQKNMIEYTEFMENILNKIKEKALDL